MKIRRLFNKMLHISPLLLLIFCWLYRVYMLSYVYDAAPDNSTELAAALSLFISLIVFLFHYRAGLTVCFFVMILGLLNFIPFFYASHRVWLKFLSIRSPGIDERLLLFIAALIILNRKEISRILKWVYYGS